MELKDLKKETQQLAALNHFKELTGVQEETINRAHKNQDVIAIGETGTGKTYAYLFSICEKINPLLDETQVVISAPTRELAYQIHSVAGMMKQVYPELRIRLLTGGMDNERMKEGLKRAPHIIVGTPGRIKALYSDNHIRVDKVNMFIIDEADMTLDYGFLEDIDVVFSKMVKEPEILCFSATFPENLKPFVKKYLKNPEIITVKDKPIFQPKIDYILIDAKHLDYDDAFLTFINGFDPYVCLIFGNTIEACDKAYDKMRAKGIKTLLIHGGLQARERQKAMRSLANEEYRYIVASDVAARGIDVEGVSHVVSLGFPKELSFFKHRAGRTGRNGKEGTCFAIYKKEDETTIKTLMKQGFNFSFMAFKNGEWKEVKNPFEKSRPRKVSERDIEISKMVGKSKKVKPNYRKKRKQAIDEIKRKERRDFIRSKIREEKKARYRNSSLAKLKNED